VAEIPHGRGGTGLRPAIIRLRSLAFPALFLAAFGTYLATACPTVSYDDTGELAVASLESGILHPPGYPFLSPLAALAVRLPAGSPAFRISVLSAALAGAAACLALRFWMVAGPGGMVAGLVFVFACVTDRALWGQATLGKGAVYGLNLCLTLATLTVLAGSSAVRAAGGALALGLAGANHWMSVVGLVPVFGARLAGRNGFPRAAALAACMSLLALSTYLWLPLRAVAGPAMNWGEPSDAPGFWFVVGRLQYIGGLSDPVVMAVGERLGAIVGAQSGPFPAALMLALAMAGAALMLREDPRRKWAVPAFAILLLASLVVYRPVRAGVPWFLEVFAIPATVVIRCHAIAGGVLLARNLGRGGVAAFLALATVMQAVYRVPASAAACDRSREYCTRDLAMNMAAGGGRTRVLFANGDAVVFGNWYLRRVEGVAPGLVVAPAPLLPMRWVWRFMAAETPGLQAPEPPRWAGAESVPRLMRRMAEANRGRFSFMAFQSPASREAFGAGALRQDGLAAAVGAGSRPVRFRVARMRVRGLAGRELDRDPRMAEAILSVYHAGLIAWADAMTRPNPAEARQSALLALRVARSGGDAAEARMSLGNVALREGRGPEAEREFREAVREAPGLLAARRNLAVILMSLGRTKEAVEMMGALIKEAPESPEARELEPMKARLERVGRHGG